jgi:adenylate kinase
MTVPVQTWGSLGTMVAEQRDFGDQTAEYLESNEVYDLFGYLLRQVVVNQPAPDKLLKFLQEQIRSKPPLAVAVVGPPGINRSKYCATIAQEYKIQHIHVGKLLSTAARSRKELKEIIEAGALVDDSVVIDLVKAEIQKWNKTGWILDGFPRTKIQAQALSMKEIGFALDKVLLLHTGEKAIRQRFAAKVAAAGFSAADREDLINSRLQQYQRHVISIAELYKNVIRQIEVNAGEEGFDYVVATIKGNLHIRPYANAPLRSHRIAIVGSCGSGRTTVSRAVAKHYGVVHVDPALLLRKHQQANGQQVDGMPPEWVSDEELCAIVGRRLSEIDCVRKGWVLDGFPKTTAQAEFLRQAHHWPTRMVHLQVAEETCVQRCADRKVDPLTGAGYYKPPANQMVADRLVVAEYDEPDKIRQRFHLHMENIERVLATFPIVMSAIPSDSDVGLITQAVFEKIDEPLPSEMAEDAGAD